jgi:ATP-dependent DNA helicase UvrD/PcrA
MDENGVKGLEEERRLAYVGLTRARRRAIVSFAANRRIYANWQSSIPSRFIDEIPAEQVERVGSAAMQRERMIAAPTVFTGQFPLAARRPKVIEVWEQPARPMRQDRVPVGARVFHQKFGYGTVTAADDDKLDIDFETSGSKRVLDRFVERA